MLTNDASSWQIEGVACYRFWEPKALSSAVQGIPYFVRHAVMLIHIMSLMLRCGRAKVLLGASGPGVDLALYLTKYLFGGTLIQLIHGPVAASRTIGRCLLFADYVFYLNSTKSSIQSALSSLGGSETVVEPKYQPLTNGLPAMDWPSAANITNDMKIFWAASLLKWKGLSLLLDALNQFESAQRPETHICFIRPKDIALPVTEAPVPVEKVIWHESPENLNEIRADASLFVSTSQQEPFGLSILEALAAGLCVLIPQDEAYWDQVLSDGVNCIKYQANDASSLYEKIVYLNAHPDKLKNIAEQGMLVAQNYRAESCYQVVVHCLQTLGRKTNQQAVSEI